MDEQTQKIVENVRADLNGIVKLSSALLESPLGEDNDNPFFALSSDDLRISIRTLAAAVVILDQKRRDNERMIFDDFIYTFQESNGSWQGRFYFERDDPFEYVEFPSDQKDKLEEWAAAKLATASPTWPMRRLTND